MLHHHQPNTGLFGTIGLGGLGTALQGLYLHGPSWEIVPPLILACAGFVGALNGWREGEHRRAIERRKLDAELTAAAELAAARRRWNNPNFDKVEGLN